MTWTNIKLIYLRELRDQARDRRTLFMIVVLPLLLYPLMGMSVFQVQQFLKEHASKVRIVGASALPDEPALLTDGQFAESLVTVDEQRLLALLIEKPQVPPPTRDQARAAAERAVRAGECDAVVFFPADFAERLAQFRRQSPGDSATSGAAPDEGGEVAHDAGVPQPEIFYDAASDKSQVAHERLKAILRTWRESIVKANLEQRKLPAATARPFEVASQDIAEPVRRRAALWSKILPFVLMVWALTGAFYPAVDLCAGEKERGTLETLLSSPAQRGEIVWGKLLTVMTFSMATSLLNLASMCGTGVFIITQLERLGPGNLRMDLGPPPLVPMLWLVVALVPVSALFSALSLAVAAFAKSSKEGQYYLMPLLMISLPLMMLPMLPAAQLDLGFALIPLSGLMLLLRSLIEGQYLEALRFAVPVVGVTAICCLLAIRWAIDQFNNESVLFRESERLDLGLWFKHLVRDRQDLPTAGEAILCGVLILVLRFFASLVAGKLPESWPQFVASNLTLQIALVAAPACLMAIMLTKKPLATLMLGRPSFSATLPAAGLLALFLHPAALWLSGLIRHLYPLNPAVLEQLKPLEKMVSETPLWQVLLVMALAPAICEELAFRGFILSGLRRIGHKWGAIALAALFFGMAHGILQQSLSAWVVGIVIGYIAVKTGSLWPGVLYHFVHNGLGMLLGRVTPETVDTLPWLRHIIRLGADGEPSYTPAATIVAALLAAGVLLWIKSLPYQRSAEERLQEALDHQSESAIRTAG
ncbi:MAG: ABC transporter permease subunit/CPBP intramembrane protease [Pirellulaceae bacterium]|nr:ABC transporter permease subunit/CPBP intramembrane protease [Pirellulaceae bacterium]